MHGSKLQGKVQKWGEEKSESKGPRVVGSRVPKEVLEGENAASSLKTEERTGK